jgi:Bacterial Ig domain
MLNIKRHACAFALCAISCLWLIPLQAQAQLGSLVVTMSSPGNGATVSGTTTVSASVTIIGLLTVQNVQFRLDGNNLGAADASSPYSISWNTTGASNGSHTLSAVATAVLGLQFSSNPVTVTVSNGPPPDTTPPSASITSPASGQTVQGTITVSAGASDNVGVAGVQFLLDGASLGAEDTSAPYSISWNTGTAADGTHSLTAVARDAAGNRASSAPVTVAVSNNAPPPPPPPPAGTRFEETDPAIAYTSGWSPDGSRSWSGGSAAFSTTPGAQATFTFTGPSVTWIGGRAPGTGIARVFVDGAFLAEVDTYSKTEEIRVSMFTASGLANTSHTLTVEVTGQQNAAATAAFIIVDAFDVPAVAVSRLQETDPDVSYSLANWLTGDASRSWSAGIAALSSTPGAQATLTFIGTGISWIGARGPQTGIARVTLDGVVLPPVDTYSPTEQIQAEVFAQKGLTDTAHTLTIEVTGQQNAASTSPLIVVDAFEVTMSGTRHQDTDPAIAYGDGWIQDNRDKAYSEGRTAESETTGAQATISFTGTGIRWIGARGPQTGIARVLLDGNVVADSIDTYAQTEGPQHTDFFRSGLPVGPHTLTIQVMGKNPLSTNAWILIDAFDVIP